MVTPLTVTKEKPVDREQKSRDPNISHKYHTNLCAVQPALKGDVAFCGHVKSSDAAFTHHGGTINPAGWQTCLVCADPALWKCRNCGGQQ